MKLYSRKIMNREKINRFGRMGFVPYLEVVKTDDISKFNYRKQIKFEEYIDKQHDLNLYDENKIYSYQLSMKN